MDEFSYNGLFSMLVDKEKLRAETMHADNSTKLFALSYLSRMPEKELTTFFEVSLDT